MEKVVQVGTILAWPTGTVPSGFLECNGASLLRAEYADLFAVLGETYGHVDDTHFTLPDFRGQFLRGWAHGQTTDPDKASRTNRGDGTTGDNVGTKQTGQVISHQHTSAGSHQHSKTSGAGNEGGISSITQCPGCYPASWFESTFTQTPLDAAGAHTHPAYGGNENRPVNINVMFIIKAEDDLLQTLKAEATVTLSGASGTIQVNIPANCVILGVQLRVDTAITGATTWNARFTGGNTAVLCTEKPLAKNTKSNSFAGGWTGAETDIVISANGNNFTAGVIRAIVYYRKFTDMPSI